MHLNFIQISGLVLSIKNRRGLILIHILSTRSDRVFVWSRSAAEPLLAVFFKSVFIHNLCKTCYISQDFKQLSVIIDTICPAPWTDICTLVLYIQGLPSRYVRWRQVQDIEVVGGRLFIQVC